MIELIALDKHWAREIEAEGNASLLASCSNFCEISPFLEPVIDGHLALYAKTGASAPWIAYLARVPSTREIVGVCSFKDKVNGGRVEIAYHTFPPYEGRGFAKAMAERLVDLAVRHPDVVDIVAHTLPRESVSTHVLRALHFRFDGEARLPQDGCVWRWVLPRHVSGQARRAHWVPMNRAAAFLTLMA